MKVSTEHQSLHNMGSRMMNQFCREKMSSALKKLSQWCQQDIRWRCHTRIRYIWMKHWKEAMPGKQIWESATSRLVQDRTLDELLRGRPQEEKRRKPGQVLLTLHHPNTQRSSLLFLWFLVLSAMSEHFLQHIDQLYVYISVSQTQLCQGQGHEQFILAFTSIEPMLNTYLVNE